MSQHGRFIGRSQKRIDDPASHWVSLMMSFAGSAARLSGGKAELTGLPVRAVRLELEGSWTALAEGRRRAKTDRPFFRPLL
jgi:hypothetical protein